MAACRDRHYNRNAEVDKKPSENQSSARIIQKNLVYVIGLPEEIASEEVIDKLSKELMKDEYFGQYGTIQKIIVNTDRPFNAKRNGSYTYSAYITYQCHWEASLAILVTSRLLRLFKTLNSMEAWSRLLMELPSTLCVTSKILLLLS